MVGCQLQVPAAGSCAAALLAWQTGSKPHAGPATSRPHTIPPSKWNGTQACSLLCSQGSSPPPWPSAPCHPQTCRWCCPDP